MRDFFFLLFLTPTPASSGKQAICLAVYLWAKHLFKNNFFSCPFFSSDAWLPRFCVICEHFTTCRLCEHIYYQIYSKSTFPDAGLSLAYAGATSILLPASVQALRAFNCCLFKEKAFFAHAFLPDFFFLMLVFLIYARRRCEHFTTIFSLIPLANN